MSILTDLKNTLSKNKEFTSPLAKKVATTDNYDKGIANSLSSWFWNSKAGDVLVGTQKFTEGKLLTPTLPRNKIDSDDPFMAKIGKLGSNMFFSAGEAVAETLVSPIDVAVQAREGPLRTPKTSVGKAGTQIGGFISGDRELTAERALKVANVKQALSQIEQNMQAIREKVGGSQIPEDMLPGGNGTNATRALGNPAQEDQKVPPATAREAITPESASGQVITPDK